MKTEAGKQGAGRKVSPARLMRLVALSVITVGCGGAPSRSAVPPAVVHAAPAARPTPESLVIRVDSVQVQERANGTSWDGPAPVVDDADPGCELVSAALILLGGPTATVAKAAAPFLCKSSSQSKHQQHDPSLPDLQLRLSTGGGAHYMTDVKRDSDRVDFGDQRFVVPVDAIPPDGLLLEVYDDDDKDPELIGQVRLSKDELIGAAGRPRLEKKDTLATFDIVVTAYDSQMPQSVAMRADEGTRDSLLPAVLAGEVVRVLAAGDYRVGSYYDALLGPVGYPGGGPKEYNFAYEPLSSAPHGCAFFLMGNEKRLATVAAPIGAAIAPVGGPLIVGINDKDPSNNSGNVTFTVERRAATAAEWRSLTVSPPVRVLGAACAVTDAFDGIADEKGQVYHAPPQSIGSPRDIDAPTSMASRLAVYTAGYLSILAPRDWTCKGGNGADGTASIAVLPPASAEPAGKVARSPGQGVTALGIPACQGCIANWVCPLFPSVARDSPCTGVVPAGERIVRPNPSTVFFEDPPGVSGNGDPSGGPYPARGVRLFSPAVPGSPASGATCTLPEADRALCTVILNDFLANSAVDPTPR